MDSGNSQKMLDKCIYDYFVKKGMCESAKEFASEVDVENPTDDATKSPGSFLTDWWNVFYDMLISNQSAQDPYAEAARSHVLWTMWYLKSLMLCQHLLLILLHQLALLLCIAHNISLVVPAFSPERSQEPCHLRMPEDEVIPKLRFLDVDRPSQGAAFVTDSSHLMEQIPNMPQQWEAKDEGEGQGIYFDQTMQMEPNGDTPKNFVLPVPDPCEAGSLGRQLGLLVHMGPNEIKCYQTINQLYQIIIPVPSCAKTYTMWDCIIEIHQNQPLFRIKWETKRTYVERSRKITRNLYELDLAKCLVRLASAAFFVTGYIQDKKCMGKTVTHAGTGCVEALDADHYLQELDDNEEENKARQQVCNQEWSLTGAFTAAPAIDYQLSSPTKAFQRTISALASFSDFNDNMLTHVGSREEHARIS
ncbi:hypothetical protein KY289_018738 [Solanum tuberosum]|nr:hypothetical protein KY284_018461 [Solanum tuberosum]KAH0691380.1 hypothetical protein KY289_018738 [Solanum tuberosum]